METKSAKQRLAYELIYPAILGSIVYEILPIDSSRSYHLNLLIGLFFCFDCYHLFFFMEKKFSQEQKDTWPYVLFDIFVAALFWTAARYVPNMEVDLAFLVPLSAITLVPFCFLVYSLFLKYNIKFYIFYCVFTLVLSIVTFLLKSYDIGDYLMHFVLITTVIYCAYVLTRKHSIIK